MRWGWVLAVGVAVLAGGCGGSGPTPDERAAANTVRAYMHALMAGDAATACSQFTTASRNRIARQATRERRGQHPNAPAATCAAVYANAAKTMHRSLAKGATAASTSAQLSIHVTITDGIATARIDGDRHDGQLRFEHGRWRMID